MINLSNIFKYFFSDKLRLWKNIRIRKGITLVAFIAIIYLILFSNFSPQQVMLHEDEVSKRDIVSDINAVVVDEKQTAELKQQAASKVQKAYQEDQYALVNTREDVKDFYAKVEDILKSEEEDKKTPLQETLMAMLNEYNQPSSHSMAELGKYLLIIDEEDLQKMEGANLSMVELAMSKPITDAALPGVYQEISVQIDGLGFAPEAQEIIKLLTISTIRPNLVYNQAATEKAIKEAQDAVKPVQKNVKAGEIIVREGERVTAEQISILEQLGIQRGKSYPLNLLGIFLFVLLTIVLVLEFLKLYHPRVYNNEKLMILVGIIFVIIMLLTRLLTIIEIGNRPDVNTMTGYLAPVAAGSMLIAILLDSRLAYFLTMVMAIYVGMLTGGNQLSFTIAAFISGTIGVYRVSAVSQISDLAKSGVYLAGVNIVSILTLSLINGTLTLNLALLGIMIGAISGILSAILMLGALPYLESAFSITSMNKLLELSNPNHYLLKRLLLEAPGTYHHSLMVGNLAEASAEEIGANPLLVRVGAYFHDIGKIRRPEYFVENQQGGNNPHGKIAPALSALIVTSHVKEGVELAREAHLPQLIIDFIAGHHGTSLAKYFYTQALEEEGEGHINEENFRYEGPKPQSKEVALVMLADSVEAAVRSIPEPSTEKIRGMVYRIIKDKLDDRQLEECDLTFKDLDVIAKTFCRVLEGVYHKRIEYPDILELTKRGEHHGHDDN